MERSKSTNSGDHDGGSEDKIEENTNTTAKFSAGSISVGGEGHSGDIDNGKHSNEGSTEKHDVRVGDSVQGVTRDFPIQMGQIAIGMSESREMGIFPPTGTPRGLKEIKGIEDVLSLMGRQAQSEKEQMEVSSPIKYNVGLNEEKGSMLEPTSKEIARKTKAEANWKRIAREKGKNKSLRSNVQPLSIGSKRAGKLVFEEEEIDVSHKRQCTTTTTNQNQFEEGSTVATR